VLITGQLFGNLRALSDEQYSTFVVQNAMQYASIPFSELALAELTNEDFLSMAIGVYSNNVVSRFYYFGSDEVKARLRDLFCTNVELLCTHMYGSLVFIAGLKYEASCGMSTLSQSMTPHLITFMNNPYARRVILSALSFDKHFLSSRFDELEKNALSFINNEGEFPFYRYISPPLRACFLKSLSMDQLKECAVHPTGHIALASLLITCSPESPVVAEICACALDLVVHPYGSLFVLQILNNRSPVHFSTMLKLLLPKLSELYAHEHARYTFNLTVTKMDLTRMV